MYGILTYIWSIFGVNVGKYSSTMEHLGMVYHRSEETIHDLKSIPINYETNPSHQRDVY